MISFFSIFFVVSIGIISAFSILGSSTLFWLFDVPVTFSLVNEKSSLPGTQVPSISEQTWKSAVPVILTDEASTLIRCLNSAFFLKTFTSQSKFSSCLSTGLTGVGLPTSLKLLCGLNVNVVFIGPSSQGNSVE